MRTLVMTAAAAVALVVSPGAQADPPMPAVQAASAHPGGPLTCRYLYHEGSVVGRPICKTEHQWTRERFDRETAMNDLLLRQLTHGH